MSGDERSVASSLDKKKSLVLTLVQYQNQDQKIAILCLNAKLKTHKELLTGYKESQFIRWIVI